MEIHFQYELSFKIVDKKSESPLENVTVKMHSNNATVDLYTDESGEVKAKKKYQAGTQFKVNLSKAGYISMTYDITVDKQQSKNVFAFEMDHNQTSVMMILTLAKNFKKPHNFRFTEACSV